MEEVELYNGNDDIPCSSLTISIFSVADGWLPYWELDVREEATLEELLALRDGVELVRVQFDKLMDIIINDNEQD